MTDAKIDANSSVETVRTELARVTGEERWMDIEQWRHFTVPNLAKAPQALKS
jgi:hypothetical protein